jgi:hypothetical protein
MTPSTANYTAITPYLLPPGSAKRVNIGDGLILDSCERLIGARAAHHLSSRAPLGGEEIERINGSRFAIVAGANSLRDDFEPIAGLTVATLERVRVPVILIGIGLYGVAARQRGLAPAGRALVEALLERFPLLSVRCDASQSYLCAAVPHHAEHVLMTSCPVAFPIDGVDYGFARKQVYDHLVVTLTDRADVERQLPILLDAPKCFRARRRTLALHQDFGNRPLEELAGKLGYDCLATSRHEDFTALYKDSDVHVGTRVHGHLKALSMGSVSFLCPFDLRQRYFAESLDFPLVDELPSPAFSSYDFARFLARRERAWATMRRFVAALRALLV